MIVLDANILIYAFDAEAPENPRVQAWIQTLAEDERIGLPWISIWAFLRISTHMNSRSSRTPLNPSDAFGKIRELLDQPHAVTLDPGPRHFEILERMVREGQAAGRKLTAAAFAAIAIEYGASLASADRDFSRFPNLKWINPLN